VVRAALAQSGCPGIHGAVLDIRNSTGTVARALFESAEGRTVDLTIDLHS